MSRLVTVIATFIGCVAVLGFVGRRSDARASAKVLHTYGTSEGHEIANVIAVNASELLPLLPPEYTLVPAASLGFGRPDQGLVAIANFRGFDPTVDNRTTDGRPRVAINVAILVLQLCSRAFFEPAIR
jgi:hypothetical protein